MEFGSSGQRTGIAVATVLGRLLGGVFFLVGMLRTRRRKALHPRGGVRPGLVRRQGSHAPTGVAWIDEPGADRVLVRLSRATGFPDFLPDIIGLALRVTDEAGREGDLLLATAGTGPVGRFVVRPTRRLGHVYSSVMPYRTAAGPLLLAAFPLAADGTRFELAWSSLRGGWSTFAVLEVESGWDEAPDPTLAFEPVLNPVPGLPSYAWAAQLRRFAYAGSRRARGVRL
jgi:hypothetical protein